MFYIISAIIFLLGLIGCLAIIGRKFALLANIDVAEIQAEKNALLKQQIIASQLKRRFGNAGLFFTKVIKPLSRLLRNGFDWIYDSLNAWQRSQANKQAILGQEIEKRIDALLFEAEELVKDDRLDAAEKKYIEIIGLDATNFRAFRDLSDVYYKNQNLNEARQTLEHALRLRRKSAADPHIENAEIPKNDLELAQAHFLLAAIHEGQEDYGRAILQIKKALKIEPNSPRYLDRLIEVSILKKDKIAALDALKKLEMANPENQKLANFRERILSL